MRKAAGALALLVPIMAWSGASSDLPSAVVREEPFAETLVEHGTVAAARLMFYGSEIAGGPAKIAEIAREGTHVAAGDLLLRFDSAGFAQDLAREQAALRQAEADLIATRESLRLDVLQAGADIDDAGDQIGYAESELKDQVDGAGKVALAEAHAAVADLEREVARATRDADDLAPMLKRGFITQMELERAQQASARAREQLALARLKRDALVKYGQPAAVDRARRAVDDARRGLVRERETAAARVASRRAALQLAETKVEGLRARVIELDARVAATEVRAKAGGLVVYKDLFFGSDRRKPQVGDEVWPKQPVIALPDSEGLVVETRVREVDLARIAASSRVTVTVDAYPELRLPAAVELIGALAEEASRTTSKSFPVTIALRGSDRRLRPGMTARVEMQVAAYDRALVVPLASVFGAPATGHYCYVLRGSRPVRIGVTLAGTNGVDAAIAGAIAAGDRVLLSEPVR